MSKFIAKHESDQLLKHDEPIDYLPWISMFSIIVLMCIVLSTQGRIWFCKWDSPLFLWSSDVWSKHNSQHLFDPYVFTHLLHGFLFLWGLDLIFHKILGKKLSFAWLLFLAVFTEAIWEVIENSKYIIEIYRANTASLEYFGDSIVNSLGDVVACAVGFVIAYNLKFRWAIGLFLLVEVILILTIKDSLLINILMLIYPIEAIKTWQTGG
ncbi:MAG: DUF2585 family protein [Pyrinomonadaceae bacterium]|nr:DUF2585 family protein [Pyrinomonadaceae bacterium]